MAATTPIGRSIQQAAIDRLDRYFAQHDDQRVFTLVEVAEATSMDPNTVETAMDLLPDSDAVDTHYTVDPHTPEYGERQWTVHRGRGSSTGG